MLFSRTGRQQACAVLLLLGLSGCATTLPESELPFYTPPAGEPMIHITPLTHEGRAPTVIVDERMETPDLPALVRVFTLFTKRYAAEFPSLQLTFVDTLQQMPEYWQDREQVDRERLHALVTADPVRSDWLLAIDTMKFTPVRQSFLKSLGRALLLVESDLPSYTVTISARLINLEYNQPALPFRIVQVDHPDRYSTVFEDRLAYTVKDAAGTLISYLRDWRRQ